jgi:kynurenine formamidase
VEIRPGDIVLIYTGHYERTYGTPAWLTDFAGLTPEAARWLAAKGVRNFGVEAVSVDHPDRQVAAREKGFPVHVVCRETGMTHMEGMINLGQLVGKGRFQFIGFPLKIEGGTGSPIRAVALLDD